MRLIDGDELIKKIIELKFGGNVIETEQAFNDALDSCIYEIEHSSIIDASKRIRKTSKYSHFETVEEYDLNAFEKQESLQNHRYDLTQAIYLGLVKSQYIEDNGERLQVPLFLCEFTPKRIDSKMKLKEEQNVTNDES